MRWRAPWALVIPLALDGACFVDNGALSTGSAGDTASASSTAQGSTTTASTSAGTAQPGTAAPATDAVTGITDVDTTTGSSGDLSDATSGETSATTEAPFVPPTLCGLTLDVVSLEAPVALNVLNTPKQDGDPFLTADGLTLYFFSRAEDSDGDIYRSTRAELGLPFGEAKLADDLGVNTSDGETKIHLSADGLTLFLAATRAEGFGEHDIWHATRADVSETFDELINAGAGINSSNNEYDVHASADTLRVYFAAYAGDKLALFTAARPSVDSEFTERMLVPGFEDTTVLNAHPSLSLDERVVIFTSDRDGSTDLWIAARDSVEEPFANHAKLPVINTDDATEGEAAMSADGCELFFASDRPNYYGGHWDLYRARVIQL